MPAATSRARNPLTHDVVIIGAGLAGAATAWHLRQSGIQDLVVLEREAVAGVHSSGRNAAMLRTWMEQEVLAGPAQRSARHHRREELAGFRRTGGFLIGGPGDATDDLARLDDLAEHHGGTLSGRGRWFPDDGVIDVAALLRAFLADTDVRYGTPLLHLAAEAEALVCHTPQGALRARRVVDAAGAWSGSLFDLPLEARNRHLCVSAPDTWIDAQGPFVWDLEAGYYLRPESGGWLLCACDEQTAAPGHTPIDPGALDVLARKLARHQPGLEALCVTRTWVGQRTFAPDRLPVIGPDPREPRLIHAAGLGGHGVTLAWWVGETAATAVRTGRAPAAFSPARLIAPARRPLTSPGPSLAGGSAPRSED